MTKKVLIVGAGFGGLSVAKKLGGQDGLEVTVIDRYNHHLFQPLLYQVATAGLSPSEIAMPIRSIVRKYRNVEVLLGEVTSIDLGKKIVATDFKGELSYDYLVLACGARDSYFGHDEWSSAAPGMKTLEQATDIRRRVLAAFEMAERESDPKKIQSFLTFVVVGGGPTGVELAGALGEITRYTFKKDFRRIDPSSTRIILVEAGDRLLPMFTLKSSEQATQGLESLGVTIWTKRRVNKITDQGVQIDDEWIDSQTVIWAAGVKPSSLNAGLPGEKDRSGRITVSEDLSLPGNPNVFVIGDQANFICSKTSKSLPGLAPVAMQQGRHVARLIQDDLRRERRTPFRYIDKGQMATIGRRRAVLEFGRIRMSGFFAWIAWLLVHIYYLIGFRNRIFVMWQWAYAYFTFRRGDRLIIRNSGRLAK